MLWRIQSSFSSKEFVEAVMKIETLEFKSYSDFEEKYGQFFSESPVSIALSMVGTVYEGIGLLLHRQLIDLEIAADFLPIRIHWEKMKPLVEGARQRYKVPLLYEEFEYFYNEAKKYYQQYYQQHPSKKA